MPTNIRPPVIQDYDDKNQREARTAIQQLTTLSSGGRFLGRRILDNASGVYTPTAGTLTAWLVGIGGGGGGGGANTGTGASGAAGGSSGVRIDVVIAGTGPITGGPYTVGAGGTGGIAAGGNGTDGGSSTIVINGLTFTAPGGTGGQGLVGTAGNANVNPTAPTLPTLPIKGAASYGLGGPGVVITGSAWFSGNGGGTDLGGGGAMVGGTSTGNAGRLYGGGGSGAAAGGGSAVGGAGASGAIFIEEYS